MVLGDKYGAQRANVLARHTIPFIQHGGSGEELIGMVFIDFPLFMAAESLVPSLLYNNVIFNFWLFCIGGTIMYGLLGFGAAKVVTLGLQFIRGIRKSES